MLLSGGLFDGKEVQVPSGAAYYVLPVVESCGIEFCGPHFSEWQYDRMGRLVDASTRIAFPPEPEWEEEFDVIAP